MPPTLAASLLEKIHELWPVDPHIEITLEANPNSVECEKFSALATAGINRISLGIQSLRQKGLEFLGRSHSVMDAYKAIENATAHFDRYSLDFIYTLPHQTLMEWEEELQEALRLAKGHLSLYQLTIEEGTPFFLAYHKGDFQIPSPEISTDFYEATQQLMRSKGYHAYEVSNYAQPSQECRHNMTYWHYHDYIGVGPGAHSRLTVGGEKYAIRRHRSPEKWMKDVFTKQDGTHEKKILSWSGKCEEFLMMGLRLQEGICLKNFRAQVGYAPVQVLPENKLNALITEGLLDLSSTHLKATASGRQKLDGILRYLFDAPLNAPAVLSS